MELPFVTLDVFTKTRYRGNPLAVVTIPADGNTKPTQERKQAIAREFNLSETVFIHEPNPDADGDSDVTRRVIDIFTTDTEIPFAGHPTIGAAITLVPQGVNTIITKAGPIALTQTRPGYIQAAIPHNVRRHRKTLADLPAPTAGQISHNPTIRESELQAPLFSIVNGMTFALINLPDLEHLAKAQMSGVNLSVDDLLDDDWKNGLLLKYYYVINDQREEDGVIVYSIRSRMMEATMEDPATGSAASALSSYLSLQQSSLGDHAFRYEIDQGVELGRESNIVVDVDVKESKIAMVKLSGTATLVMRGHVSIN
ncbi:phenazine biosynthesis protein [Fusarium austroafricanum]|uniref:Phenazine biosynthesis protein n=1 Tax=Fusarium austroafricanum TaxID=2364996 RepID=A0A8H4K2N2_9HYPO|nr:phenazine biosynthesis protein [Fusarium austroafricanum]